MAALEPGATTVSSRPPGGKRRRGGSALRRRRRRGRPGPAGPGWRPRLLAQVGEEGAGGGVADRVALGRSPPRARRAGTARAARSGAAPPAGRRGRPGAWPAAPKRCCRELLGQGLPGAGGCQGLRAGRGQSCQSASVQALVGAGAGQAHPDGRAGCAAAPPSARRRGRRPWGAPGRSTQPTRAASAGRASWIVGRSKTLPGGGAVLVVELAGQVLPGPAGPASRWPSKLLAAACSRWGTSLTASGLFELAVEAVELMAELGRGGPRPAGRAGGAGRGRPRCRGPGSARSAARPRRACRCGPGRPPGRAGGAFAGAVARSRPEAAIHRRVRSRDVGRLRPERFGLGVLALGVQVGGQVVVAGGGVGVVLAQQLAAAGPGPSGSCVRPRRTCPGRSG